MAGERTPPSLGLKALGTYTAPPRPRGSPGAAERQAPAPPPAPLAFLAPWLEGAVDLARGALWGSEGAADTAAAKGAELAMAGLPLAAGLRSLKGLGFFSRVDKALDLIPVKGAHPNKVASLLKSNASAEELAYRGVPEFLASKGNATVTRAELAAHLAAHPAPMPVVKTRGGPSSEDVLRQHGLEMRGTDYDAELWRVRGRRPLTQDQIDALPDAVRAAAEHEAMGTGTFEGTKYAQYQVPGGEQYRETLVTLPPPPKPNQAALEAQIAAGQARLQELYQQAEGLSRRGVDAQKPVWAEIEDLQTHHRDLMRELSADPPGQFRSGHFEEPNILVHTRANERTLPTGERGRFVEEVQSDWHQKGKKQGYGPETEVVAYYDTPHGPVSLGHGATEAAARASIEAGWPEILGDKPIQFRTQQVPFSREGVPDAPFKETWPDLGLKQQVLETAADPNAEWIGFTGGGTQADRYDLSKRFSEVHYSGGNLKAYDHDGNAVLSLSGVSANDLPAYIGEEGAAALLAQPKQGTLQSLRGVDLQVGGKGMAHFYDRLLPSRLEKIVKPFGGTVERMPLGSGRTKAQIDSDMDALTQDALGGKLVIKDYNDAMRQLQAERDATIAGEAWFAKLTPEMKARILKEGLPLMSLLPLGVLGTYGQQPQEPAR